MDQGAHFHQCDFQVHSPRDRNWNGKRPTNEDERKAYGERFVAACRQRGLHAVAITDHHDFAFFNHIKAAARDERDGSGNDIPESERLVVYPGMELTLGVPCQALLILDAMFPTEYLPHIYAILAIETNDPNAELHPPVKVLEHFTDLSALHGRLDETPSLRGHYIILPNVSETGNTTLLRSRFKAHYKQMPCVGGYLDGPYSQLASGNLRIIQGLDKEYGNKAIGVFPTSDNRRDDFAELGKHTAWVKWAEPTAEALRQACLARHTRILHRPPVLPTVVIQSLEVSNSRFLGPIVLEFNSQYNCLIGGRGTGKYTILEYLRWALCDQPPASSDDDDDVPDFQAKRTSLINKTLVPLTAVVTVGFSINGVPHCVRRESATSALSVKIADGDFRDCTEQEIRDLLPVRAYSQKQLSAVGVRTDELVRFIEAPVRKQLSDLASTVDDLRAQIRTHYHTMRRKRALDRDIARDELGAESLQQQIDMLRRTLTGLSDQDRRVLFQHDMVLAEERIIAAWMRDLERLEQSVRQVAQEVSTGPRPVPDGTKLHHSELIAGIESKVKSIVEAAKVHIDAAVALLSSASQPMVELREARRQWGAKQEAHTNLYEAVKQRASSQETQLREIGVAEERLRTVRGLIAENREKVADLGEPDEQYLRAKGSWVEVYRRRGELLQEKCEELTALSGGRIRASISRGAGTETAQVRLLAALAGTNIRGRKIEELFAQICKVDYPAAEWDRALTELEGLAQWGESDSSISTMPTTPMLAAAGLSAKESERIGRKLSLDDWLEISLIELADVPRFEYQQREKTYIDFREASAGQQATALLRVLLNQDGPSLIIDQPEDDLDNQVILEIVQALWNAKMKRQIIYSSHNANLVVNGDADLVVICGYRTLSDQSLGMIEDQGAIDVGRIRGKITAIMEGGKEAFQMRRDKYGF